MKTKFNVKSALHKTFKKKENLKLKKTNIHINNHSMMGIRNFKPMNYYQKFESDINNPNEADKLNHLQSKSSAFERKQQNINKTELDSEIFEEIKILWQELGIKYEYQNEFESYLINIENPEKRMKYLTFEKNNLTELKNSLIKFRKEKQLRTRNIELLKELNSGIYISLTKEKKIKSSLIKQVVECIKEIRISSINLIRNLIKIRENLVVSFSKDKINYSVLYKNFLFQNNYLLKMNFELKFLKSSEINKIFEINNEENFDTFLTMYIKVKNNNEKLESKMSTEILNAIEKCRYYLFQEGVINNLNNMTLNNSQKKFYLLSKNNIMKNSINFKTSEKNNLDSKLNSLKSNFGRNYRELFLNSVKKVKVQKIFLKKNMYCSSEPKSNLITIERESIKDEKNFINYMEKKFLKNAIDNIKSKEKNEKNINFGNLNIEQTEIVNYYSSENRIENETDNINNIIEKEKINEINIEESENHDTNMNNMINNIEKESDIIDNNLNERENNDKNNINNNDMK